MKKLGFLYFFVILMIFNLFSGSTVLEYKNNKRIKLFFSNQNGSEYVRKPLSRDKLYFTIEAIGGWKIKKSDLRKFEEIKVTSQGRQIEIIEINPNEEEKKIVSVTLSIPTSEKLFYQSLIFAFDENSSEPLNIDEEYWPLYDQYLLYLERGDSLFKNAQFPEAFTEYKNFFKQDPGITGLSFYPKSLTKAGQTVNFYLRSITPKLDQISIAVQLSPEFESIDKLNRLISELNELKPEFQLLLKNPDYKDEDKLEDKIKSTEYALESFRDMAVPLYEEYQMLFFQTHDYSDLVFKSYIEYLTELLLSRKDYRFQQFCSKIDSLQLTKESDYRDYLLTLSRLEDFTHKIAVINNNITTKKYLFPENVLLNLEHLQDREPEPFYYILKAFNEYAAGNIGLFKETLSKALPKITNEKLLFTCEMWIKAANAYQISMNDELIEIINSSLELQNEGNTDNAISQFQIAASLANTYSVPKYHLGKLLYESGRQIESSIYLQQALNLDFYYHSPRLLLLQYYFEVNNPGEGLENVESVIDDCPFWIYYFYKAKFLGQQGKYEEAIELLDKNLDISLHCFKLFILFGDFYQKKGDIHKAIEYYNEAGLIEPTNPIYIKRIKDANNTFIEMNQ